jgi:hypothetical protein
MPHPERAANALPVCVSIGEQPVLFWLVIRKSTTGHLYKTDVHGGKGKERV